MKKDCTNFQATLRRLTDFFFKFIFKIEDFILEWKFAY